MQVKRSLRHPDALLATWFGAGLAPKAPGTFGSLAVLPFGYLAAIAAGPAGLLALALLIFAIGLWAAERYVRQTGDPDPKEVVIDEAAAQLLPLAVAPVDPVAWLAAFLLFRLFDVLKPWPCNYLDRNFKGGVGVMADDGAAGLYALLCMVALAELGAW